ncbi:hypothetical protein [Pannonibacter sp. SL95]|uniref:hypothetical protein n=1 Tax=Pannonibacter sp. SL95 TaxID=2995153 RepID=UPI0022745CCB|nr:hypothetical protein [Pannonibacter sp. SL95]MCY1705224.1 hypothetical protein [Pannonibacter sp. SL95]
MMSLVSGRMVGFVIVGTLVLAIALVGWQSLRQVNALITIVRASAIAERDAHWRGEIQAAEARTAQAIAGALRRTMAAEATARDQIAAADARAAELEKANAQLPDSPECGLGRDRVRLLNGR